jgi:hypothetical protein
MKFNKWTVGLAAVGAVSIASVARAEEHAVMTTLANTTISGYVDTSVQWDIAGDSVNFPPYAFNAGKQDGFNLNVVKLTLEKPLDEGDWAAGYKVDLLFGPDATGFNASSNADGTSDFGIKQAYVALRVPVLGNGIDFKIGTFDTVIGYEVFESGSNPNFTRSYGYTIEPTQHTGVLASHKWNDYISSSIGVANTHIAGINARNAPGSAWAKTFMGSVALTAPDDWGFIGGSTLYVGSVHGRAGGKEDQHNYYIGGVLKTPVAGLTVGAAFDYVDNLAATAPLIPGSSGDSVKVLGLYTSYAVPDSKLSLHGRGEYFDGGDIGGLGEIAGFAVTGTVQYDLWQNVISRLEARWDHITDGDNLFGNPSGGSFGRTEDHYTIIANFIYKF